MRLLRYIGKRLLHLVPVLLGVTVLVFFISHAIPGDPARMMAGQKASREAVENLRRSMGLDRPLHEQYLRYMKGLLHGDLGRSVRSQRPVVEDLKDFFPATLELTLASMTLCLVVGLPLGILSAVRRNRPLDHASRVFSVCGVSMPVFWLGLMLLLLFYRNLQWLPGSGRLDVGLDPPASVTGLYLVDALLEGNRPVFLNALSHIILPAFCLSYVYLAVITRIVRSSMIAVMEQDYVTTARANGISEPVVILKHCLKNSLIPTVTIAGLSVGELLGGAILTETIFGWPGMGKYVVDSVNFLDFPAIMGFTLVVSLSYVLINLAVDVIYAFLNPQIRY
ncbi:peptide/nickel transport system permease protein [Desulfacinum infernum DSM 9756]|uniref:Peptide/nickel transport system permease protein n=1 Tax=Desulfacinum infernum DSM 9756 TaxID=1121391 RepID=A0A1M4VMR8_9BACT|nr:ABC transporter permease [Desulfacinum infernum]SHE70152.1 peptide/nickel transport system permease protein [Desulfacinum infernum DSM 9756]